MNFPYCRNGESLHQFLGPHEQIEIKFATQFLNVLLSLIKPL